MRFAERGLKKKSTDYAENTESKMRTGMSALPAEGKSCFCLCPLRFALCSLPFRSYLRLRTLPTVRSAADIRRRGAEGVGALAAIEVARDLRGLQQRHFRETANN